MEYTVAGLALPLEFGGCLGMLIGAEAGELTSCGRMAFSMLHGWHVLSGVVNDIVLIASSYNKIVWLSVGLFLQHTCKSPNPR